MHEDLLACYAARIQQSSKAHAFMTVSIVVGPDGRVQGVETKGGALLGDRGLACIVDRIRQGEFTPPTGGGTMRIEVPLTFRRVEPGEAI